MKDAYSGVYLPACFQCSGLGIECDRTDYEPYIKADKMRYYSLAHYLWLQGFDPWFVNYRDTGRGRGKKHGNQPQQYEYAGYLGDA